MSWSLFLPVFETANLLSGMVFFGWVFWHVLPVPSFIAVCLSGGVLAWDGLEQKGRICGGEGFRFWWPPFRVLFANCAQSIFEP